MLIGIVEKTVRYNTSKVLNFITVKIVTIINKYLIIAIEKLLKQIYFNK